MSDLHRAVDEEIAAFRPDRTPSFAALRDRHRTRARRRTAVVVAVPVVAALVAVPVVWTAATAGDDRLTQQAASEPPGAVSADFGVYPVLDLARFTYPGEPGQPLELPPGGLPDWLPDGACSGAGQGLRPAAAEAGGVVACAFDGTTTTEVLRLGPAALTAADVAEARAVGAVGDEAWEVQLMLTTEGAAAYARVTGEAACAPMGTAQRRVAFVVDSLVLNGSTSVAPDVACGTGITTDTVTIAGAALDERAARGVARAIAGPSGADDDAPTGYTITYLSEAAYTEQVDAVAGCLALPGVSEATSEDSLPPRVSVTVRGLDQNERFRTCLAQVPDIGIVSGDGVGPG